MTTDTDFTIYDEFEKELKEKYPELFVDVYCGIAISPGWFEIVKELSATIHHHYKWKTKNDPSIEFPRVAQIKEKFGGLRYYIDGGDEYAHGAIQMAESWAARTCEKCGKPGERRQGGWIRTLCDEHEAEYQKQQKERFKE